MIYYQFFIKYSKVSTNKSKIGDPGTVVQQLVEDHIKGVGLEINPRFGTWDYQSGDLTSFDPAGSALVK